MPFFDLLEYQFGLTKKGFWTGVVAIAIFTFYIGLSDCGLLSKTCDTSSIEVYQVRRIHKPYQFRRIGPKPEWKPYIQQDVVVPDTAFYGPVMHN